MVPGALIGALLPPADAWGTPGGGGTAGGRCSGRSPGADRTWADRRRRRWCLALGRSAEGGGEGGDPVGRDDPALQGPRQTGQAAGEA